MAEIKLTKNELRLQQARLSQLMKYLPTLQLKKAMLQAEVQEARNQIEGFRKKLKEKRAKVEEYGALLAEQVTVDPVAASRILKVNKRYENIAGVEVPYFESVEFGPLVYNLFETPPWLDAAIEGLRGAGAAQAEVSVAEEKKAALEAELREVSIRVNLFEKILIPRAQRNIKKIKVFLGDQQLSAVGRAKVAKGKIEKVKLADRMQVRVPPKKRSLHAR